MWGWGCWTLSFQNFWSRSSVQFSRSFCVWLFATPWTAARQASLSFTISRSLLKPMSIQLVMPSNHLVLCGPLLLLQSFPASGSFQMSQLFTSGSQSIGVSTSISVLPMNTQDWSPLRWTGWIFLQFKGLSRVFSNTTIRKHQFFSAQPSLWSSSHIHTPIRVAKIQESDNAKCWQGCGTKETLIRCWWECKMVQPFWKTSNFLQN